MRRLVLIAAIAIAPFVQAAEIRDCDTSEANARNVKWADPTRDFANGAIRLIALDTEEPACCAAHLMVLHPDPKEPYLACTLISQNKGFGWAAMHLKDAVSSYDPSTGLTISVPVDVDTGEGLDRSTLEVVINQATGSVAAR